MAEVHGVVFTDIISKCTDTGLNQNNLIGLIVTSYSFIHQLHEASFIAARASIEHVIKKAPYSSYAWSRLSTVLLDGYYCAFGGLVQSKSLLELSYKYALKAKELNPKSSTSNIAYSNSLFAMENFDEAVEAGEFSLSLNPMNVDLGAEHGYRRALKGGWAEGLKLIEGAADKRHSISGRRALAKLCFHFLNEEYSEAAEISKRVNLNDFFIDRVINVCVQFEIGNEQNAKHFMELLFELRPSLFLDDLM